MTPPLTHSLISLLFAGREELEVPRELHTPPPSLWSSATLGHAMPRPPPRTLPPVPLPEPEDLAAPAPDPGPAPWTFTKLTAAERARVLPGSAFLPASDDPSLPPEFELVLHHPERAGTVPVRAGGAGTSAAAAARAQGLGVPVERAQMQVEELRQFKALCDRLLPGLRTHSHLCAADARSTPHTSPSVRAPHTHIIFWAHLTTRYTLIHLCDRTHSVTLSEHGEVIGGATFRLIQATNAPVLLLEVLLLAVEQRTGVCGRGHGTRRSSSATWSIRAEPDLE